jgi:hypothetical protein
MTWPIAGFDEIRRLRVLHAAMPGTLIAETRLRMPFAQVWEALDDIGTAFPELLPDVRRIDVDNRTGERFTADVTGKSGLRSRFEIVMRPGWCVMRSRFLTFAMAAVPDGEHTTFGYLTGVRFPGTRRYGGLLRPLHGVLARRTIRRFERRFGAA